jgi:hypothetical protein
MLLNVGMPMVTRGMIFTMKLSHICSLKIIGRVKHDDFASDLPNL